MRSSQIIKTKYTLDEILIENSFYFSISTLKKRLFRAGLKKEKCELCGQGEIWKGKRMSLILDHINGIYDDHRIENLRIVCPNCNATLDTHCGKNITYKKPNHIKRGYTKEIYLKNHMTQRKVERPKEEILLFEVKSLGYSHTGRKYGVSDNTIRKWLKTYKKYGI